MATKFNNLEHDIPLEVGNWRHSAEIAIVHEVENGTVCTVKVYTDGSNTGDSSIGWIRESGQIQKFISHKVEIR